ncbi:hypothetical protein SDC9_180759 [bioreactor metagenome]|uniref:Uncharacterized protein n=1 Tax=bioreactor metagenome TaxID=1076179 RepID=A0A645HAZ0_9ZZZZ
MHMVIQYIITFYGTKGPDPHMQCNLSSPDAFSVELIQQLLCKMQTGSWCGSGTCVLGVNGLIALLIL